MYVYFIQAISNKKSPIKIGVSLNPDKRLQDIQVGNPYKLHIVAMFECETRKRAFKMEAYLHYKLRKYSMSGEWFKSGDWNLHKILKEYDGRIDKSLGDFKRVKSELSVKSLQKENKNLKLKIKELENQIDEMLDKEFLRI